MAEVGGCATVEAASVFTLCVLAGGSIGGMRMGGACVGDVHGWAALEGASGFVPSMVAVGITVSYVESTENCASGDVAIARSHEMSQKQRAHLSVYMYIYILSDLLVMHSDLLVTY